MLSYNEKLGIVQASVRAFNNTLGYPNSLGAQYVVRVVDADTRNARYALCFAKDVSNLSLDIRVCEYLSLRRFQDWLEGYFLGVLTSRS